MTAHTDLPVVVGVDGSPASLEAVRWAAAEAARHKAPLHLVYGIGVPIDYGPGIGFAQFDNQAFREAGAQVLASAEKLAKEAGALVDDLEVATFVSDAGPIPTLVDRSKAARLLVVGTRGLSAIGRGLLGSVSTSTARHAACPVAVIPEPEEGAGPRGHLPVVVGVDGSECSKQAIALAYEEASARRVELIAVTTWSEFSSYLSREEMQERANAALSESLAGYSERYPDVELTRIVVEDRPARRLLTESERAQLVVVGSHGRGGFVGMTLGSVSQSVLHGTKVPLIIARQS